jgi:ABC-type sugar transport system ATPase subunit/ribose/xylose/arabinose/galactoside ABC-type transport system permease subunit
MKHQAEIPLIRLHRVSKGFPGVRALDDVSLGVQAGTIHALLGENGAGKSTLINVLSGVLQPDSGTILLRDHEVHLADARVARARGIATVHQEADLFPDFTVAQNIALEHGWPHRFGIIDRATLVRTTREALQALRQKIDPERLGAELTAAERQLVCIAAGLSQGAAVLVLDEPTSSLSETETRTLLDQLRGFRDRGGAILYVSHRLEEVFQLADLATVLRDGKHVWTGPLAATTAEELVARMVGRPAFHASRVAGPGVDGKRRGPVRLACHGLTAADRSFDDVTLEVRAGEILGLYGLVGAGRSEWAQGVVGLRPLAGGRITLDGVPYQPRDPGHAARSGLAYLPEDRLRLGLCASLSVRANAALAALRRWSWGPFISTREETRQARNLTEQLMVRLRSLLQPAGTLSGGNQQKVILGRWLACEPQTLILDEPTRGVDVGAKAEIHELLCRLAEAGRAVVLISSDLPEVSAQSDRVGVFRSGRLAGIFDAGATTAEAVATAAMPLGYFPGAEPIEDSTRPLGRRTGLARIAPSWVREAGLAGAVLALAAFLAWRTDTFWQAGTLRDICENAALLVLCGMASALVILTGGIDISFGSMMALTAASASVLMRNGWPPLLATSCGLGVGALAGAANAGLTLVGRVHPIVVTLGTMSIYRGLTLLLIAHKAIHDVPGSFRAPIRMHPLGVPAAVWLALGVTVLAWFCLVRTVPGRQAVALGSNPRAAQRTGIHRTRVWLGVFSLQGLLAATAGLLALGMAGHLQSTDFEEKTLEAIGVAVVGGIAITGGRGSVWGIWAAAFLLRLLEKGWVLLQISGYWQRTIVGSLLLLAILTDRLWRRSSSQEA